MKNYFSIELTGNGAEIVTFPMTKDQYDYWDEVEDTDEGVLEEYMNSNEIDEEDMDFMNGVEWCEAPIHHYGCFKEGNVEVNSCEEDGTTIEEVCNVRIYDWEKEWSNDEEDGPYSEFDFVDDVTENCVDLPTVKPEYGAVMIRSERGSFFKGIIEIEGDFIPGKLKLESFETYSEDDVICKVMYDGEEVECSGEIDTIGKGVFVRLFDC